ncbi:MAG: hypothetical protein ACX94A_09175, partial [Algiphilus sp.]
TAAATTKWLGQQGAALVPDDLAIGFCADCSDTAACHAAHAHHYPQQHHHHHGLLGPLYSEAARSAVPGRP